MVYNYTCCEDVVRSVFTRIKQQFHCERHLSHIKVIGSWYDLNLWSIVVQVSTNPTPLENVTP